jgi:hypothetical protein
MYSLRLICVGHVMQAVEEASRIVAGSFLRTEGRG